MAAETYVEEHPDDTVVVLRAEDFGGVDELMDAAGSAFGKKGIDTLAYFGHSYEGGMSAFAGSDLPNRWINEGSDWSGLKFNKNAEIFIFGCNGGTGGKYSLAQRIANATGVTTYGYTSDAFFTDDPKLGHFQRKWVDSDWDGKYTANWRWLIPSNGLPMTKYVPE